MRERETEIEGWRQRQRDRKTHRERKRERKKEEEEEAEDGRSRREGSRREKLLSKTTVIGSFSEGQIIRRGTDLQRSAP